MTVKFQYKSSKAWFKGTLLGFIGDQYLVLFGDSELLIDPERVILS